MRVATPQTSANASRIEFGVLPGLGPSGNQEHESLDLRKQSEQRRPRGHCGRTCERLRLVGKPRAEVKGQGAVLVT